MSRPYLRRFCAILLATAATSALLSSQALAGPVATSTVLDTLGGYTFATGLSADGSTVVGYTNTNGVREAVSWSVSGLVTVLATGATSRAQGISADGSTIVGFDEGVLTTDAWAYRNGVQYFLPHNFAAGDSQALDASADGAVVVGFDAVAGGYKHAVSWSNNNWSSEQDLGALATLGGNSQAHGVNADGTIIVGYSAADDGFDHAFFWQGGVMNDLGTTGFLSSAEAISADGSTIVGYRYIAGGDQRPVAFTGPGYSTATDLGSLGGTVGGASAVSADGSVIVGASTVAGNPSYFHAFRYADGTMADINTLLTTAGVDMTGVLLTDAEAVSADGRYIVTNDDAFTALSYLVFYDAGVGGITNQVQQQSSVDALARQRQAIAIQHDAYAGILTGDLDRRDQSSDIGVLGLVGSVVGGVRGHFGLGKGFSLTGGVIDGTSSFGGADIGNGFLGAAALRYDSKTSLGGFTPYAQIGGSFGVLSNVAFTRDYGGGTGRGTADGRLASLYARLGITREFETGDQISLEAEIGNRWLFNDAYSEDFSATNPFPASVAAGTDHQTVAKLGGSWTHPISPDVDLTLHAALGTTLGGDSGLSVHTTGFGTMTATASNTVWGEFGAHAAWAITQNATLDLYATTIAGPDIGTNAHVGAGYRYKF